MRQPFSQLIAATAIALVSLLPAPAQAQQDGIARFDIARFEVDGNTLLPPQELAALLAPFAGRQRDFGDVQRALEALEGAYHARGFSVVQVALPEQELNQGVVRLHVVETRLGKLRIEGNRLFDEANIRNSVPGLREGQTPNIAQVSSSLKLANENPAKKTSLQLQSGAQDDEIDAVLKVADEKPWRLGATIDNTGNSSTGDTRLTVQYQNANVADRDQVLSLQYTTTLEKPNQVSVYGAGYHIPLYTLGDSVDLFASYSDVDSGSVTAGIFNLLVSGKGTVAGARYNHHLHRHGDYESRLAYGFDYKAYQNNVMLQGIQLGNDVTVHPLSIAYGGTWTLAHASTDFNVAASHNIAGGDRGGSADFNRVRNGAASGYNILRFNAGYSRALAKDWQLRVNLSGQYTRDMLVPGEQFGAGGATSVRGFDEREIANDRGELASAELYTPNLCGGVQGFAAQCRVLTFYDAAHVARNNALPGELAQASISSVGLGFRMAAGRYWALQLDAARVVDSGLTRSAGDSRVHFQLALSY
jgi:hemolysin activation/secretion protein